MGWSYAARAGWVIDKWTEVCLAQTGSQNTFRVDNDRYFFETSRREHSDGAITGTIWKFLDENRCKKAGTFRIEGDGTVTRAPAFLKKNAPTAEDISKRYHETFHRETPEERRERNHAAFEADKLRRSLEVPLALQGAE